MDILQSVDWSLSVRDGQTAVLRYAIRYELGNQCFTEITAYKIEGRRSLRIGDGGEGASEHCCDAFWV
jgi:hypothetical protein